MTADQDKLIADLLEWATLKGNHVFVKWLVMYYELLKKRESKNAD